MACLTADNPVHAGGSTTGKISPVQVKEIPARETFFKENEKKNLLNEKKTCTSIAQNLWMLMKTHC